MSYLKNEFRKAALSRKTFFAFFMSVSCLAIGAYEPMMYGNQMYDFAETFILAQTSGVSSLIAILFPLICCIPYATSYIEEMESGHIYYTYTKLSKKKYIISKLLVNGVIGGSVIAIPCLLLLGISLGVKGTSLTAESGSMVVYGRDLYLQTPIAYVLLLILNSFICGFIFANLALGFSAFLKNKYLTILMPFGFYIFSGVVLSNISIYLNAITLFDVHQYGELERIGIILYDIILFLAGGITFAVGVYRRKS